MHDTLLDPITGNTHLEIGPLRIWITANEHDWSIALKHDLEHAEGWERTSAYPRDEQDLVWTRFARQKHTQRLHIQPAFPPRSIVIRPEAPYAILPGDRIQFFMSVPMSLHIQNDAPERANLLETPARILSNTWFGEPTDGELCFASRTRAMRSVDQLTQSRHRIICPVRMKNTSKETLNFERFCLRVSCLNLYQGERHFWGNEIGVTYKGPEHSSRVAYADKAPSADPDARLIMPATTSPEHFNLRSFYSEIMQL